MVTKIGTAATMPPLRTLAQWVVSAAKDKPYRNLLSYAELADILQVDPQGHRGRSAILKAQRMLLDDYNKYLANVAGKGYEIAHPSEHARHVKSLRRQGIRKVTKSHRVGVRVDYSPLTAEELRLLIVEQTKTGTDLSYMRRIESKRKIETVRKEMTKLSPRSIAKAITGAK